MKRRCFIQSALLGVGGVADAHLTHASGSSLSPDKNSIAPDRLAGVVNYSMPLALDIQYMYVKATGTDITDGDVTHGFSEEKAFQTHDAALLHAKKYARFNGRLNALYLKFDNGAIRSFNLGSNLQQGDDYFPFVIGITSIDNDNRAQFDSITCGSWMYNSIYVTQVDFAYVALSRLNMMRVSDVGIQARRDSLGNVTAVASCFYAALGSYLHLFGEIKIEEEVTCTSAFLYCQQNGNLMLENGDVPAIFPQILLSDPHRITSPYKYRGSWWECLFARRGISSTYLRRQLLGRCILGFIANTAVKT
ncbi:hypothetical protein LP421_16930 [Rhizobium sp. RCAM05350]|nr:hypothetical protein LP421_16930 [Rhizobium sp. RCAM05350]